MKKILFIFMATIFIMHQAVSSPSSDRMLKVQTCAACHGAQGISGNPEWPNLAGQHPSYLTKQLLDYKVEKTRKALIMTGIVASLSKKDIDFLSKYYATFARAQGKTSKKYLAQGEKIYRTGDSTKGITACIACHGPKGDGNAEAGFPVMAGQRALYTIQQLQAFKSKTRQNDLNHIMRDISARMTEEDMAAVAYYMAGLH